MTYDNIANTASEKQLPHIENASPSGLQDRKLAMSAGRPYAQAGSSDKTAYICLFLIILISIMWDSPSILFGAGSGTSAQLSVTDSSGDSVRQACFTLIFIAISVNIYFREGAFGLFRIPVIFVPILVWCWLSLIWALDPSVALRRVAFTTILIISVSYSTRCLTYRATLNTLLIAYALVSIADWVAMAVFPLAVHPSDELDQSLVGNWRGIHNHKNEAGAFYAIFVILFTNEMARTRSYIIGTICVISAGFFLYMSHSKTSGALVSVAMAIGLFAKYGFSNPSLRNLALCGVFAFSILGAAFASDRISDLLLIFEDPGSLTGRVQIWPILMAYAGDHPLLGAGYGSFWAIGTDSPILAYGSSWVATIDHAHNGYIDLLIQIGGVGLLLVITGLIIVPFYKLFFAPLNQTASRYLICSVLAFGCLHDLLETSLLERANPTWIVMLIMYCLLANASKSISAAADDELLIKSQPQGPIRNAAKANVE